VQEQTPEDDVSLQLLQRHIPDAGISYSPVERRIQMQAFAGHFALRQNPDAGISYSAVQRQHPDAGEDHSIPSEMLFFDPPETESRC
jgi:hypothetical protein